MRTLCHWWTAELCVIFDGIADPALRLQGERGRGSIDADSHEDGVGTLFGPSSAAPELRRMRRCRGRWEPAAASSSLQAPLPESASREQRRRCGRMLLVQHERHEFNGARENARRDAHGTSGDLTFTQE